MDKKKKKKLSFIKSAKRNTLLLLVSVQIRLEKKDKDRTIYLFNCLLPFLFLPL